MRDFGKALAHLQGLRGKFEGLLQAARANADRSRKPAAAPARRLQELTGFGANPGNLRMFVYAPQRLPRAAPLVLALHGCSQTAEDYDHGSGWSTLAERLGFVVVFPQQQPANNPKNCFSWFVPDDIARGRGEAYSIQQMVEHTIARFGVDRRRIFVTGLSAGGAMASVMLATYPEMFAGGAIIAGLPFGCAHNVQQALEAMFSEQSNSAVALGDRVRAASRHRGPWPKISVWHGTADQIVNPGNAEEVIRQWTNLHGVSATPSYEDSIRNHRRRVWTDADGEVLIEAFCIAGMAHGVPLATSLGADSCGACGPFFLDAGISSTHHLAGFWRLGAGRNETAASEIFEPPQPRPAQVQNRKIIAGEAPFGPADAEDSLFDPDLKPAPRRGVIDPNRVIAAAFKAAGMPAPKPSGMPGASTRVAPGPIIEAALKGAARWSSYIRQAVPKD